MYKKHSRHIIRHILTVISVLLISLILGAGFSVLSTHVETTIAAFEADVSIEPAIEHPHFDSDITLDFGALGRMHIQLNEDQRLARLSNFGLSVNVIVHDTIDGTITNWKEFNIRSYQESLPGDVERTVTGLLHKLLTNMIAISSLILLLILALYILIKLKKIRPRPLPICGSILIIALVVAVFIFTNQKPVISTFSEELLAGTSPVEENTYEFDMPYGHVYTEGLGSEVTRILYKTVKDNDEKALRFVDDVGVKLFALLNKKLYKTNEEQDAILLVSDIHDNIYMAKLAAQIARDTDAVFVLDDGDITTAGTAFEKYYVNKILGYFTNLKIPYIFTTGNHDKKDTVKQVIAAGGIAFTDKADIIEVGSYRIAAANDPYFYITDFKSEKEKDARTSAVEARAKVLSKLINKSEEEGENIDLVLVHDPKIAQSVELDKPEEPEEPENQMNPEASSETDQNAEPDIPGDTEGSSGSGIDRDAASDIPAYTEGSSESGIDQDAAPDIPADTAESSGSGIDQDAASVTPGYTNESSGSGIDRDADSLVPGYNDENSEAATGLNLNPTRRLLFLTGHQHQNSTMLQREDNKLIFTATNTNGANRKLSDSMLTTGIGIPTKRVEFLVLLYEPGDTPGGHTPIGYYIVTVSPKGAVSVSDVLTFE
jgi:predicted phosphodiesterase